MLFRKQSASAGQRGRYVIRRATWVGSVFLAFGVFTIAAAAVMTVQVASAPLVDPIVDADELAVSEEVTASEDLAATGEGAGSEAPPTLEPPSEAFTFVEIFHARACNNTGSPRAGS